MNSFTASDRNISETCNQCRLRNMGRLMRYKTELNKAEYNDLQTYMKILKELPTDIGQVVLAKYYKLATFYASKDKSVKHTDYIERRFVSRNASDKAVAESLNISVTRVRELNQQGMKLIAELLLKETLKRYKLITPIEQASYRGSKEGLEGLLEEYKKHFNVMNPIFYNVENVYFRLKFDYELPEKWVRI